MPWTNQGGTNEDGSQPPHGPWGKSQSGSGDTPPGLEAALRRGVDRLRAAVPALLFTRRSLALLGGAVLALWLLSGVYFVNAGSQCIVLRFGAVSTTTGPGMHYHLPWPVEVAYQSNIDKANWSISASRAKRIPRNRPAMSPKRATCSPPTATSST